MRYFVVADPRSLRCRFYVRELEEYWSAQQPARRQALSVRVIDWRELCAGGPTSDLFPVQDELSGPAVLRVESPARDPAVIRALLQRGQRVRGDRVSDWPELVDGWIAPQPLLFAGLQSCLQTVDRFAAAHPEIVNRYCLEDVLTLFDKNRTAERLRSSNLPVPGSFAADRQTTELGQQIQAAGWEAAYLKLATGSCASGIVKLDARASRGITTTQQLDGRFYNSYRVRTIEGPQLEAVLAFLLDQTATVQQAIPKARVGGHNFDVRVVVLQRTVIATIFRVSRHPMTNLHLGGRRGDARQCRAQIPQRHWLDALDHCEQAAALFDVPCVGIDVAFDRYTGRPWILEMNAFGDFFPRWTNDQGQTIHRMEIEHTAGLL